MSQSKSRKDKRTTQPGAKNKSASRPRSYTPISDALSKPFTFADTELSEGIQRHGLGGLLAAAMHRKRRCDGEPLHQVLCALLVWPLLKVKSMHCFCAELCQILLGKVSVLYDFLGREDINWRGLSSELAHRVYKQNDIGSPSQCAFVVDDTSKARSGRKVQGTSCYYDHTQGRTLKGHQMLQLGLAGQLDIPCSILDIQNQSRGGVEGAEAEISIEYWGFFLTCHNENRCCHTGLLSCHAPSLRSHFFGEPLSRSRPLLCHHLFIEVQRLVVLTVPGASGSDDANSL